jgi:omega-3 fatty acid desaturase (delta-15 desaturase)
LFVPNEKKDVITSTVCWFAMVAILVGLGFAIGPIKLLMLYGIPYIVSFMPFSLVSMSLLFESIMTDVLI